MTVPVTHTISQIHSGYPPQIHALFHIWSLFWFSRKQDGETCSLLKVVKKNSSWPLEISVCPAPLC